MADLLLSYLYFYSNFSCLKIFRTPLRHQLHRKTVFIIIVFQPFFTERVFQIFDKDNSGSISMQEFLDAMHQFAGHTPDDKMKFLFKVYDLDGKYDIFT